MAKIVCGAFVEGGKVLLVRRASHRKWSPNRWDLVGGHVEKGEALDVAIVRECKEEVGLMPLTLEHVTILFEDEKPKTPFHVYTIRSWEGGAPALLGTEHSELGWFTLGEVGDVELALPSYRPVILQILAQL